MIIKITENEAILLMMIKVEARRLDKGFDHDLQYGILEVIDKILDIHHAERKVIE